MDWSDDIISVLHKIRKNSYSLYLKHKTRYIEFKTLSKYFDLPVIILSVFSSSFSSLNVINEQQKTLTTTVISMFIAILTSIKLYLNLNNVINEETSLSKDYYLLAIDIYKILNLDAQNRIVDPHQYLNDVYSKYIKLTEQSTVLYRHIKRDELVIDIGGLISSNSSVSSEDSKNIIITTSTNI